MAASPMRHICYGISNGPYYRGPRDIWQDDDRYLWHTPWGCPIAVQEKADLVLTVPEFDSTKSTSVKITLSRKGSDVPVVEFAVNSYGFYGKPELVWGES